MKNVDVVLAAILFFVFPAVSSSQERTLVKIDSPAADLILTASEIDKYSTEALDGSGESAVRLARYFEGAKRNLEQAEHWYLIGAENGSAEAQHAVWVFSRAQGDLESKKRGLFWLKKAAEQGDKLSQQTLARLSADKKK